METVHHIPEQNCFVIKCDGLQAVLHYQLSESAAWEVAIEFDSTFVPPEFRGRGFAEKLVRTGIKWAKEQEYELHASCWYAAKFIR
jgi:predicted GNAT family acetyltransferase